VARDRLAALDAEPRDGQLHSVGIDDSEREWRAGEQSAGAVAIIILQLPVSDLVYVHGTA
jgi:hypothetical protein